MSEYDNTNRGAVWRNDRKETDSHPDFKGSIDVEGVEYWLSGWQKKPSDKENAPVVKFQIQKKEAKQAPKDYGSTETKPAQDDGFDDIPF